MVTFTHKDGSTTRAKDCHLALVYWYFHTEFVAGRIDFSINDYRVFEFLSGRAFVDQMRDCAMRNLGFTPEPATFWPLEMQLTYFLQTLEQLGEIKDLVIPLGDVTDSITS